MFNIFILFKYIPPQRCDFAGCREALRAHQLSPVWSKALLSQKSGAAPLESVKRGYDSKK